MTDAMTSQDTRALLDTFIEVWASRDADRIEALLADDVVLTPPRSIAGPIEGGPKVAAVLSGAAAARFLVVETMQRAVDAIIADGPSAAVVLTLTAELVAGGEYENSYCWLFTCRDGAIATITEFTDTNHAVRAFSGKA